MAGQETGRTHLLAVLLVTFSGIDTGLSVLELLIDLSHRDLLLSPPGRREDPGGPAANTLVREQ